MQKLLGPVAGIWLIWLALPAIGQELGVLPLFELGPERMPQDVAQWLEMSAQFNERLLATVYWALGSVIGLVVLVVGVNWFSGQRTYERDKATLEATLRSGLEAGLNNIREEVLRAETGLRSELTGSHTTLRDEALKLLDARGRELSERLDGIVSAKVEPLQGTLKRLEQSIAAGLKNQRRELTDELARKEFQLLILEARSWMPPRDVPANALRNFLEALDISISNLDGVIVPHLLEWIESAAQGVNRLGADDSSLVEKVLGKLAAEHSATANRIRTLLKMT